MLAPHHGENPQFGVVRLAFENFLDALEFFPGETVFRHHVGCDRWINSGAAHRRIYISRRRVGLNGSTDEKFFPKNVNTAAAFAVQRTKRVHSIEAPKRLKRNGRNK